LAEKGVDFESVHYIEKPLSKKELEKLLHNAGLKPRDAMRTGEAAYQQHVAGKTLSDDQLLQIMAEYPELLQRPIVARGTKAVLARSTDKLSELDL
jgi:arsenate reductase